MYKSKSEMGLVDRKRINDALDKHLERSSPSTSRGLSSNKDKDHRLSSSQSQSMLNRNSRAAPFAENGSLSLSIYVYVLLNLMFNDGAICMMKVHCFWF